MYMSLLLCNPITVAKRHLFKCVILLLISTCIISSHPRPAHASGTFISAPSRTDMVYDDQRGILYIANGSSVLRYNLSTDSFLSPFVLGGQLNGIDISQDGNSLAVANENYGGVHLVDLRTEQSKGIAFSGGFGGGGSYSVAFGKDGSLLVTSRYLGWSSVPLRRYDSVTKSVTTLASVSPDTMLSASADASVIGFAESDISDGRFGRYRVSDGSLLRKQGYTDGTSWFNYEIGVNRDGTQYALPTYGGTFITDSALVKRSKVGIYAYGQPIGVVYNPVADIVYFPWATSTKVYVFETTTLTKIWEYDLENYFDHPGNQAFTEGRLKISRDGRFLFATVAGGVRYIDMRPLPFASSAFVAGIEDTGIPVTLGSGSMETEGAFTYRVIGGPSHGSLQGTSLHLTYVPDPDYNGADEFQFRANNDTTESAPATVSINISPVNDRPSFSLPRNRITIGRDTRVRTVAGWAAAISRGPADESYQGLAFSVSTDKPWLFSRRPSIDSAGTLTLAAAAGMRGRARVTVVARDSGGTLNGGVNRSGPRYFTVVVDP